MTSVAMALLLLTQYQLDWRDLPQQTLGRKVALTTPDGATLKGRVLAFEPDGMRLKIAKTSDAKLFPKGDRLVPRGAVTELRVEKTQARTWRVVATAIVGGVGMAVGMPVIALGAAPAVGVAVMGVGAGLGYLMGWSADRKAVRIRVNP